jgi:hypothetical protein
MLDLELIFAILLRISQHVSVDATPYRPLDVAPGAALDISIDVAENMATNIDSDIAANISFDTAIHITKNITFDTALNVALDISPHIIVDLQDAKFPAHNPQGDNPIDFFNLRHFFKHALSFAL